MKPTPTSAVIAARGQVRAADRHVNRIEKQLVVEKEKQARLAGITEGRTAGGKMTAGAGKRAADQAERVGLLTRGSA